MTVAVVGGDSVDSVKESEEIIQRRKRGGEKISGMVIGKLSWKVWVYPGQVLNHVSHVVS